MAGLVRRLISCNRDLIASSNLTRSLSVSPSHATRSIHTNTNTNTNTDSTQIPPFFPPSVFSNVFDPLGVSTRNPTQGQLMKQHMEKCKPFLSAPGIMGIGGATARAWSTRDALNLNMYKIDGIMSDMKRSFSSSAVNASEQSKADVTMQSNANITRPLSPHLPIYRPQTNSLASIFNRISGAYLTVAAVAFILLTMQLGPVCFTYYPFYLVMFYSSKFALLSAELAALAVAYHLFHSFPHLFADARAALFLRRPVKK